MLLDRKVELGLSIPGLRCVILVNLSFIDVMHCKAPLVFYIFRRWCAFNMLSAFGVLYFQTGRGGTFSML